MDKFRIPRRIRFPFNFSITVVQVSPKHEFLYDSDTGEQLDGVWDSEFRRIILNKALPTRKKRYILAHEVEHAVKDWVHELFLDGKAQPTGG